MKLKKMAAAGKVDRSRSMSFRPQARARRRPQRRQEGASTLDAVLKHPGWAGSWQRCLADSHVGCAEVDRPETLMDSTSRHHRHHSLSCQLSVFRSAFTCQGQSSDREAHSTGRLQGMMESSTHLLALSTSASPLPPSLIVTCPSKPPVPPYVTALMGLSIRN